MKIICMYLPQYHEIEENNKWWGKGYTEWSAVKRASPLFKNHYQPHIPLNNNFYDLSDPTAKTWKWQAELAQKYNVFGFCIYHYWFKTGKQLLEKPMEILLNHPEINVNYCISWANESWTRVWYGLENQELIRQEYGGEQEWISHFNYLLPFFKDSRYIKVHNRPMINIYRSHDIEELEEMRCIWDRLAQNSGFSGVYIVSANTNGVLDNREKIIDAYYNFEPGYTIKHKMNPIEYFNYGIKTLVKRKINTTFHSKLIETKINAVKLNSIMKRKIESTKKPVYLGTYPTWDNSARRKYKCTIHKNTSPELFKESLDFIKQSLNEKNMQDDFVYINAWNEWGEGCHLEPDNCYGYQYLEALKKGSS